MPKNIDDVILPERRKSIRNIPIPEGRRRNDRPSADGVIVRKKAPVKASLKEEHAVEDKVLEPDFPRTPHRHRGGRKRVWIASTLGAVILLFAVLSLFGGATLAYVPKSANLTFNNDTLSALKSGQGKLIYSVVKLSGDKSKEVPASGEAQVSRKASGVIVVYNDASTAPQTLVENTRFESPSGKVYRIQSAITIPGKKTVSGTSQPGSVEATVYADAPGAEYNSAKTDFTLPGLKGSARYTTVYARSKTDITGGFVGMEKSVKPEDATKAKVELKAALTQELVAKAQAEVPADFILFPSLSSVTFEDLPQVGTSGNTASVSMRGHLYGVMFKRTDLARALAEKKISVSKEDPVELISFDAITLGFAGTPPADLLPLNELALKVSGSGTLLWRTDEVALKSDLLGRSKSDLPVILKNYPTISSASATLRPFWKSSFPEEGADITIKKLKTE